MHTTNVTSTFINTPLTQTTHILDATNRLMDNFSTVTQMLDGNTSYSLQPSTGGGMEGGGGGGFPELQQARTLSIVYGIFAVAMGVSGNLLTVITIGM